LLEVFQSSMQLEVSMQKLASISSWSFSGFYPILGRERDERDTVVKASTKFLATFKVKTYFKPLMRLLEKPLTTDKYLFTAMKTASLKESLRF